MTPTLIVALLAAAFGLGLGTVPAVQALRPDPSPVVLDSAEAIAATATTVEAALVPAAIEAETHHALATAPAANLAISAAVQPGASPLTVSLAAYVACLSYSQAGQHAAAAFDCPGRAKALDQALITAQAQ
jgi:hypothetical protein